MSVLNLNGQDEPQTQTFEEVEKERDAQRRKAALVICAVLLVIVWLLAMLLCYLWKSRPQPAPPPVKQTQDVVTKEQTPAPPPEQVEKKEPDVVITLSSAAVELRAVPAQRPEGDVMYQLVAGGVVLAQSSRLKEDQPLEKLTPVGNVVELIAPGTYDASFWCIFYGEDGGMETKAVEEIVLTVLE